MVRPPDHILPRQLAPCGSCRFRITLPHLLRRALIFVICGGYRSPSLGGFVHPKEDHMPLLSARTLLACCAGLLSIAAHTGPGMAVYLRSYYTEYEVTLDCTNREHLSAADAAMAKDAMAKIEAYYLKRDSSINKDKVLKQAVANKNQAFKMMQETTKVDARQFCQASLNDLISKVREIDADATPKSGS